MLSDSHGPTNDHSLCAGNHFERRHKVRPLQSGFLDQSDFVERSKVRLEVGESRGVRGDEETIDGSGNLSVPKNKPAGEELEQRMVTAQADGEVEICERRAAADETSKSLRVLEPQKAGFRQRIDDQHLGSRPFRPLEGCQHARVITSRVLPGDDDPVGAFEVLEFDGTLPDTESVFEGERRRLVAHVGAIGEVVRAEASGEKLIGKRSFVPGPPGGVEDRLVWIVERSELTRSFAQCVVPGDGLEMCRSFTLDHRLGETTLLTEPPV